MKIAFRVSPSFAILTILCTFFLMTLQPALAAKKVPLKYNINEIKQMTGNPIRELPDSVVWAQHFSASPACSVANDKTDYYDYPICAPMTGNFLLKFKVGSCALSTTLANRYPYVQLWYRYPGTTTEWTKSKQQKGSTETEPIFSVASPGKEGARALDLWIQINELGPEACSKTVVQQLQRRVLSTFAETVPAEGTLPNKRYWFDRACWWAHGQRDTVLSIRAIRDGFYANNQAVQVIYLDRYRDWKELLPPVAGSNDANCVTFSDVLVNVCRVTGLTGFVQRQTSFVGDPLFITTASPCLDPNFPGMARRTTTADGTEDRYVFTMHDLREFGGRYYDATFGNSYPNRTQFVAATQTSGSTFTNDFRLFTAPKRGGNPYDANWGHYAYRIVMPAPPVTEPTDRPVALKGTNDMHVSSALLSFNPGSTTFGVADLNFDGYYDQLFADVDVNVTAPGDFFIIAALMKDDSMITSRKSFYSAGMSTADLSGGPGTLSAHLEFSGEDIQKSGYNAPYRLIAYAYNTGIAADSLDPEDSLDVSSSSGLFASQFGELQAYLTGAVDNAVNTDAVAGYNVIRNDVTVSVRRSGLYKLYAVASKDTFQVLAYGETDPIYLGPGVSIVQVDIPGAPIRKSGQNGPYGLTIGIESGDGLPIHVLDYNSQIYSASSFDLATLHLAPDSSHSDMGMDTGGDPDFESLRMQMNFEADAPGSFTLTAGLADAAENIVVEGESTYTVGAGPNLLTIDFGGASISGFGSDGPYSLAYVVVRDTLRNRIDVIEPHFLTGPYQADDFNRDCDTTNYCADPIHVPGVLQYSYTAHTCCATDPIPCIPATGCADTCMSCSDSCYCSGPDVIYLVNLASAATCTLSVEGPFSTDEQLMIFTDCSNPMGSCIAASDSGQDTPGGEELILTLPAGIYYVSTSIHGECGDLTLEIRSDQTLDVELASFELISGDGEVQVLWSTASESDLDHFEILRNGQLFHSQEAANAASGTNYAWLDENAVNDITYTYSLIAVEMDGARSELASETVTPSANSEVITEFALYPNFPNPFNPETSIRFDLAENSLVTLTIYNITGQEVAKLVNGNLNAGSHTVNFDGANLTSGVYLYRLTAGEFTSTMKMVLMK
ncbi:MAG: T9SS type A sorting domain-containing protein [bacterium]|nr:T9SS type A sorting domain-containing protein [bacterium]